MKLAACSAKWGPLLVDSNYAAAASSTELSEAGFESNFLSRILSADHVHSNAPTCTSRMVPLPIPSTPRIVNHKVGNRQRKGLNDHGNRIQKTHIVAKNAGSNTLVGTSRQIGQAPMGFTIQDHWRARQYLQSSQDPLLEIHRDQRDNKSPRIDELVTLPPIGTLTHPLEGSQKSQEPCDPTALHRHCDMYDPVLHLHIHNLSAPCRNHKGTKTTQTDICQFLKKNQTQGSQGSFDNHCQPVTRIHYTVQYGHGEDRRVTNISISWRSIRKRLSPETDELLPTQVNARNQINDQTKSFGVAMQKTRSFRRWWLKMYLEFYAKTWVVAMQSRLDSSSSCHKLRI